MWAHKCCLSKQFEKAVLAISLPMQTANGSWSLYINTELILYDVPYSAKFLWVFNFVNFTNFQLFAKLFQWKFLIRKLQFSRARASMDNIPGLRCCIRKGRSPKRYLRSRHCFADRCESKCRRQCGKCVLDRTCLYATPILHYVACPWFRQHILAKSSKTAICENLDPQKFCTIQYSCTQVLCTDVMTFIHL